MEKQRNNYPNYMFKLLAMAFLWDKISNEAINGSENPSNLGLGL